MVKGTLVAVALAASVLAVPDEKKLCPDADAIDDKAGRMLGADLEGEALVSDFPV